MFDLTGLELAKRLKDIYSNVNIVFVTGYAAYMGEAFHLHASGSVSYTHLGWLGRHSLAVYMVHQPLLLAAVWALARIF